MKKVLDSGNGMGHKRTSLIEKNDMLQKRFWSTGFQKLESGQLLFKIKFLRKKSFDKEH